VREPATAAAGTGGEEGPAAVLARWVAAAQGCASGRALEIAREAWLDLIACMVAGAGDEATARVRVAARRWGSGDTCAVGDPGGLPAPGAALVNGTAAHALDYDDNFHPMAGHASAVLVPAVLACAERAGASGRRALDAYVVGLEAAALLGDGVGLGHYERGWHSTSTVGTVAAAAACAHLLGLDAAGVQRAIGIGTSFASGSKRQFGTHAKPMHAGMAAMHGVMAADLAASGVGAHAEPLEGSWGFRDLFAGDGSPGFDAPLERLGKPLAIERYGLKAKLHPDCASTHCAVDGVVALMREHHLGPADVARVEVVVARMSYDNLMYPSPATPMEARFSMHYAIALAVLQGGMGLADFTPAAVVRERVRDWLPRVHMRLPREGERITQVDNGREPAHVMLHLAGGGTRERFVQHPVGVLENPMTPAQRAAKLEDCAAGRLDPQDRDRLQALLLALDGQANTSALAAILRRVRTGG